MTDGTAVPWEWFVPFTDDALVELRDRDAHERSAFLEVVAAAEGARRCGKPLGAFAIPRDLLMERAAVGPLRGSRRDRERDRERVMDALRRLRADGFLTYATEHDRKHGYLIVGTLAERFAPPTLYVDGDEA